MFIDFQKWINALTKPVDTFAKEKGKADWTEAVKHLAVAGVISGIIAGLAAWAGLTAVGLLGGKLFGAAAGATIGAMAFVAAIIMTPITMIIGWIISSGILYIFALLFGAKGNFKTQSYLIALYLAPVMLITTVIGLVPIIGGIVNLLIALWSLYLLTMALKTAHGYSAGRAVATWLLPVIVVVIIFALLAATLLGALLGSLALS